MARAQAGAWIGTAWAARLRGDTYAQIAEAVKRDPRTVSKRLAEHAKALAAEREDGDDALTEYIEGCREDLRAATEIVEDPRNRNAQISALRLRAELREKIAAALGVSTQRVAVDANEGDSVTELVIRVVPTDRVGPPANPAGYASD